MKGFAVGLLLGAVLAFFAGMNIGKGKPILSNPFAERPLMEDIKDTATRAIDEAQHSAQQLGEEATRSTREASQRIRESTNTAIDTARETVRGATTAETNKDPDKGG